MRRTGGGGGGIGLRYQHNTRAPPLPPSRPPGGDKFRANTLPPARYVCTRAHIGIHTNTHTHTHRRRPLRRPPTLTPTPPPPSPPPTDRRRPRLPRGRRVLYRGDRGCAYARKSCSPPPPPPPGIRASEASATVGIIRIGIRRKRGTDNGRRTDENKKKENKNAILASCTTALRRTLSGRTFPSESKYVNLLSPRAIAVATHGGVRKATRRLRETTAAAAAATRNFREVYRAATI